MITLPTKPLSDAIKKEIVASCPTRVYALKNKELEIQYPENCMYCMECVKDEFGITVGTNPGRFIFDIETVGQLSPEEVVISAMDVLRSKLKMIDNELPRI